MRGEGDSCRKNMQSSVTEAVTQISGSGGEGEQQISMPLVAMGTAAFPFTGSEAMKSALHAIRLGYRHFDTAALYQSEEPLGEAIAEALRLGLISSRQELFITSKLWCTDAHAHRVRPALRDTLKKLGLECLDLYLIHFPASLNEEKGGYDVPFDKEAVLPMDIKAVWAAMEDCQRLGLTRSIGVSNFTCKKITHLLSFAKIPPAVNQVEMNPVWQQKKLRELCKQKGILVTAFSPLGGKGTTWGTAQVMGSPVLKDIAEAKGKTVAQIALRWVYEQGVGMIVKSFNEERLKENIEILDWCLTEEELRLIDGIPQRRGFTGHPFVHEDGPIKTVEDIWDGEM